MYYMNNCMEKSIIYHEEENQYLKVKGLLNVNCIEIYGSEHLLRALCNKWLSDKNTE